MLLKAELTRSLEQAGQLHLCSFINELNAEEQSELIRQIESLDLALLQELINNYVLKKPVLDIPSDITPAPFFPLIPRSEAEKTYYQQADAAGETALRAGKVAALTVAGGQGSRLGFDGPKGTYPIAPVSGKTLFQYFAESLQSAARKYAAPIHWYIMTSTLNDQPTRDFFAEHNYFGLPADSVHFFTQGFMPAVGYDGKLLLSSKGSLALSPDGPGGTLLALRKSGMLDDMQDRGVEYLSYFQVDNPLVPVVDKRFIGLHILESSQMSAITLAKTNAFEKVGNFCMVNGKLHVIEYSDLPEELATAADENGQLKFIAGSPAIHVISRTFVEKLTASGRLDLDWHRADKKIKCIDAAGNTVDPAEPNGVKLESFIFDALPMAEKVVLLEGDRSEVFAPTKNLTGVDSVDSCRQMISERNARRLEKAGVTIPRNADGTLDAVIEIDPRAVCDDDDAAKLVERTGIKAVAPGEKAVLG